MPYPGSSANASPSAIDYVVHSLFGLVFLVIAGFLAAGLFSKKLRARIRWGGRVQITRLGILLALPFSLFVPARYIVAAVAIAKGHEKDWGIPAWWFLPCMGMLFVGGLCDRFLRR